jgi:uracil-DNA glycosylase
MNSGSILERSSGLGPQSGTRMDRSQHRHECRVLQPTDPLVADLAAAEIGATFNFYRDGSRAGLLRRRLAAYLCERRGARVLLVGEAAGYRGARVSGLPFTSERQLTGAGPAEATATVVHRALGDLGVEEDVLLWNLVPTHPHVRGRPDTNRPPTRAEIRASRPFLDRLAHGRTVIAVGRLAEGELGVQSVRHPSHGGAALFAAGLAARLGP